MKLCDTEVDTPLNFFSPVTVLDLNLNLIGGKYCAVLQDPALRELKHKQTNPGLLEFAAQLKIAL